MVVARRPLWAGAVAAAALPVSSSVMCPGLLQRFPCATPAFGRPDDARLVAAIPFVVSVQ